MSGLAVMVSEWRRNPFKKSLKVVVPRGTDNLNRKVIYDGFQALIGDQVRNLRGITPAKSGNNWIITFTESYDCSGLFDKKLTIGSRSFNICSGEFELDPYIYQSFRFHWLPIIEYEDFDDMMNYCKSLSRGIEVVSLQPEFCIENGMKTVFNGNYRLRIRFLETNKEHVKIETGMRMFKGLRTLLTRLGEKPKCLHCSSESHLRRDCPLLKIICEKCNKKGHEANNCNIANRIKPVEIEDIDLNEDDLNGEVEDVQIGNDGGDGQETNNVDSGETNSETVPVAGTSNNILVENSNSVNNGGSAKPGAAPGAGVGNKSSTVNKKVAQTSREMVDNTVVSIGNGLANQCAEERKEREKRGEKKNEKEKKEKKTNEKKGKETEKQIRIQASSSVKHKADSPESPQDKKKSFWESDDLTDGNEDD